MVPFSFFGWQKSVVSVLYRNEMHYVNNCALHQSLHLLRTQIRAVLGGDRLLAGFDSQN
jgi:hypothetical protein